ncbi:MAG: hypothetical protein WDW36_009863 [Sanguina aurantia]
MKLVHSSPGGAAREPWDFQRFVKTVLFFNEPPSVDKVLKGLVSAFQGTKPPAPAAAPIMQLPLVAAKASAGHAVSVPVDGIIMVTGATGGVGKRVVEVLLASGKHVRALARDVSKARALLSSLPVAPGGKLDLVGADITQKATLLPEYFVGVRAVVSCTAVKVAPKEADVDRAKYFQGITFYDPQIVGDTPQTVELIGIQNLLAAVKGELGTESGEFLLRGDGTGQAWGPLDDVVMGGVSTSAISVQQGAGEGGQPTMVFSGNVSVNNSGGFASVRTRNFEPPVNGAPYEGLELRLKGDGQRYKFIIRDDSNWDGVAHTLSFDTQPDVWQTVRLRFADFVPVFRAKTVPNGTRLNPRTINSVQLMLSKFEYDGRLNPSFRAGAFQLPLACIRTCLPAALVPRFVHLSSAGVTRPNRPGIDVNVEPPAVRMNDELGGILTYKLAGEDAVRESGIPFAVVRPCALTEEPLGAPLLMDQGDVIKGKIARQEVAELCAVLLSNTAAADTTFEIKSTVPFSQPWQMDSPPARDWSAFLSEAGLRQKVTGRTLDGVYTGKEPEDAAKARPQAVASKV